MPGPVRRRRGAALVEFALVGPLFILIMVGLIQVCFWFWNQETLSIASREAARSAVIGVSEGSPQSAGAAELSRLLAGKVTVVTPAYPVAVAVGVFAATNGGDCLAQRNTPNASMYSRLGWDWTCLDFRQDPVLAASFPGDDNALGAARSALLAGIGSGVRQIFGNDGGGALWLGPHGETTIAACYIAIAADGSENCLYEITATVGEDGRFTPADITETVAPGFGLATVAPVLVRVHVISSAPTLLGIDFFGPLEIGLEGYGSAWIDRYRPTCPAPILGGEYVTGACGGVH